MEFYVHNLTVMEVIYDIMDKLEECISIGDRTLRVIRGHKHGTRIRDNIRSNK